MKEIIIGSAVSSTPGVTNGWLKTGELPDGSPLRIPVVIVRGASEGPTLWLHGCVHGNEYCGAFVIHELTRSLDVGDLAGTVIALPMLNITASQLGQRMSPFEGMSGGDLNRCFPGKAEGGMTARMAHAIYQPLRAHATHLIDFHGAQTFETKWALFAKVDGAVADRGAEMARAFGFTSLPTPPDIFGGMLARSAMICAARDGIPSLIVEIGGKGKRFNGALVADGHARLLNVLRTLKMLPGDVTRHEGQCFINDYAWVYATQGGLFQPVVKCGDRLRKGDLLGPYYDIHGDPAGEARSPHDGEVLAVNAGPVMANGETLLHIGLNPREV